MRTLDFPLGFKPCSCSNRHVNETSSPINDSAGKDPTAAIIRTYIAGAAKGQKLIELEIKPIVIAKFI